MDILCAYYYKYFEIYVNHRALGFKEIQKRSENIKAAWKMKE